MVRCVVVCLAVASSCVALGQDADEARTAVATARTYVAFWKPFVGTWDLQIDGDAPARVVWCGEETASGLYYTSRSEVDGRVVEHGLHGYDPAHKCWKVVEFGVESESRPYTHRTAHIFLEGPTLSVVRSGATMASEEEFVRTDGTVLKTKAKSVFKTVESNRIEYVITDRMSNGEKLPDQTVIMKRR